ncbi:hypothetical protein BDQ17DRAFT_1337722 [Cyathus striatus]|nr:hypothetical protein BDQ17DRAFT_1337722 [Cyathus striatus]
MSAEAQYRVLFELPVTRKVDGPSTLTGVCTKWRDIVSGSPSFWTSISIYNTPRSMLDLITKWMEKADIMEGSLQFNNLEHAFVFMGVGAWPNFWKTILSAPKLSSIGYELTFPPFPDKNCVNLEVLELNDLGANVYGTHLTKLPNLKELLVNIFNSFDTPQLSILSLGLQYYDKSDENQTINVPCYVQNLGLKLNFTHNVIRANTKSKVLFKALQSYAAMQA